MERQDQGFTLVETIVAIAVFALVAGSAQLCFKGALTAVRHTGTERKALMLAKTLLASAGMSSQLREETVTGESPDNLSWSIDVRRHDRLGASGKVPLPVAGYWVNVNVQWRETNRKSDQTIELTSLKLGRPE